MFRSTFKLLTVPALAAAAAFSLGGPADAAPKEGGGHGSGHGHDSGGHYGGGAHYGGGGHYSGGYYGGGHYSGGHYSGGHYGGGRYGGGRYGGGYYGGGAHGYSWIGGYQGGYGRGLGYGGYWPYYSGLGLGYGGLPDYGAYNSYYYTGDSYYGASTYPYAGSNYLYSTAPTYGYTQPVTPSTYQSYNPAETADTGQGTGDAALMRVQVTADAVLWFDGTKTSQAGSVREFTSPPLTPGEDYTYHLRARWMQNGQVVESNRDVPLHAGDRLLIDMRKATTRAVGGAVP